MSETAAETVLGLDNIPLELPIAGVGSRVLAVFVDFLIQGVIQIVWVFVFILNLQGSGDGRAWLVAIYLTGAFLLDWGYFAGTEVLMRGRTLGKKVVGLRVVSRWGGTASPGALVTRNLLRVVDLVVGVPLMMIDPLSRRLGDRLAGTLVVHDRALADEPLLRRIPRGWQAGDVSLVESLLRRVGDLEPARADAMAYRILERITREEPSFLEGASAGDGPLMTLRRAFGVRAF
ncbi:MAG TPA: RDD family protein [Thermoanaerobaculia bacterium]|nr:RDD family protein [Thermoanaerobaculia bacterium]